MSYTRIIKFVKTDGRYGKWGDTISMPYKVLIVDDDLAVRYLYGILKCWSECGFQLAAEAKNGREALSLLDKEHFDLMITDIRMPGIDGLELLEEIRERGLDLFVIIASSYNEFEYARKGLRLGAIDYVVKPITEEMLKEVLLRAATFIEERIRREAGRRAAEEKEQDAMRLYQPVEKVKQLYEAILHENADSLKENYVLPFVRHIGELFNWDDEKTSHILYNAVSEVWDRLCSDYRWLPLICPFSISVQTAENFPDTIFMLKRISERFGLKHKDGLLNKVCTLVLENIKRGITVEQAADLLHMNKDYLGKVFKQKTGMSFGLYVRKLKVEYAKELLKSGKYRSYEVAGQLGYSTPDYFTRIFREETGMTPSEYKRLHL